MVGHPEVVHAVLKWDLRTSFRKEVSAGAARTSSIRDPRIARVAGRGMVASGCRVLQVAEVRYDILDRQVIMSKFSSIRSEEHTSELQSLRHLVCRLFL